MPQSESPILLNLEGQSISPGLHLSPADSNLSIRFSQESNSSTIAHIVHIPMSTYELDRDEVLRRDGQETDLGEIPSLIYSVTNSSSLDLTLKQESLYDVLAVHDKQMVPTRIVTAEDDIPDGAVIDELKLMIAMRLDLLPNELKGISAQFIANTSIGYNRNQLAYFGLKIGDIVATIAKEGLFDIFFVDANNVWANREKDEIRKYILSRKNLRT